MKALIRKVFNFAICILQFTLCNSLSHAQQVEFSSSLNPVGSGARATGMGGAFIGVADDATAASWNPAGLVQLEKPEVSLVYAGFRRAQTYGSEVHPEIDGTNSMDMSGINYASAAFPFKLLNRNMVVSLNYQRLYEMNKKVDLNYNWETIDPADHVADTVKFRQQGYLYALSPAMAVQVNPSLYIGATLNFWKDLFGRNGWENTYRSSGAGSLLGQPFSMTVDQKISFEFEGFNMHAGFLWNATPSFIIGGVYKSAFTADLTKHTLYTDDSVYNGSSTPTTFDATEQQTLKMPASYGLGLQYRHSDALTFALDAYQTKWSRFYIKDSAGVETDPISGLSLSEGRLKDTAQLRLGVEYVLIGNNSAIALRGGLFSDPEPATGRVDRYHGFSFGTGYTTGKFSLDAAYQFRKGKGVTSDIGNIPDNKTDVFQHTAMVSGIWYF